MFNELISLHPLYPMFQGKKKFKEMNKIQSNKWNHHHRSLSLLLQEIQI